MSEPSELSRPFTSYLPEHFPTSFGEVKSAVYNLAEGIADFAKRVAAFVVSHFQDIQQYCIASRQASGSQDPVFENRENANHPPRPLFGSLPIQEPIHSNLEQKIDAILTSLQKMMDQPPYEPKIKEVKPPIVTASEDESDEAKLERIEKLKKYDRRLYDNDRETSSKLNEELARCYRRGKQETDKTVWKLCTETKFASEIPRPQSGYSYSVADAQGRRHTFEDTHVADAMTIDPGGEDKNVSYFGVFDGHGGSYCSEFVAENLGSTLTASLKRYWNKDEYLTGIANALKMTCVDLNDSYNDEMKDSTRANMGTTAVIAVVIDGYLWIANVGDSRALLVLPKETVQLSDDARPLGDGRFDQSITRRAGKVYMDRRRDTARIQPPNHVLPISVARDLGLGVSEGCLTARPKVLCVKLSSLPPGTKLALVCDGITEVASTNQIGASIRAGATAADLVKSAFDSGSKDNLTAMVIDLH